MTTATHESEPGALGGADDTVASTAAHTTSSPRGAAPASESERSRDFEVQIAIQTIASRILGSALLERAQEADSIAT